LDQIGLPILSVFVVFFLALLCLWFWVCHFDS